ncbi:MAG: polysaccharide biosynthesis protein [Clostridia bacterium]|nr:polysaccharide biosynthesis protein [Clostridia bacterium]
MITYIQFKITMTMPVIAWAATNVVLVLALCLIFRLYSMVFASVGFPETMRVIYVTLIVALVNVLFVTFAGEVFRHKYGLGFNVVFFYSLMLLMGLLSSRFLKRGLVSFKVQWLNVFTKKKRVLIVGCNNDAFTLIRHMVFNDKSLYKAVGIVEDDNRFLGKRIYDVRVVGTTQEVGEVVKKYHIDEIFIAIPSMKKAQQREIIMRCRECGCPLRLLPELSQMTGGEITVSKLRNVEISDLLGREQVSANLKEVAGYIEGKVVLVTGGGGSIGSELCRQIAMHNPKELIILDIYENNIYDIEQELKRHYPELALLTLVASIRDKKKIEEVFRKYRPQIVFNAAAHKHVPLMETSPNEAVKNNVFGTLNVAKAADKYKAETFVQISTDKAVNPTNVMGASKRICEMIVQTIGKNSETNFVAVRFGNVLGSNGSVIPLFKKQIEEGGPVTVTHKDIIRYFMTIPEAVSLVLQAGAYAKGGQIFVLDMGEPVRIYDLAYNLIKLSGYEPNVDIDIICTGLRPGEKLYEERLMDEEGLQKTENGQISIAQPIPIEEESFWATLDKLYKAAYSETDKMKELVHQLVPTYTIDARESVAVSFLKKEAILADEKAQEDAVVSE